MNLQEQIDHWITRHVVLCGAVTSRCQGEDDRFVQLLTCNGGHAHEFAQSVADLVPALGATIVEQRAA